MRVPRLTLSREEMLDELIEVRFGLDAVLGVFDFPSAGPAHSLAVLPEREIREVREKVNTWIQRSQH
ncbi:MAG TPA: hypothetical protein VF618_09135 [Thermoanaerobaculia bacterium]